MIQRVCKVAYELYLVDELEAVNSVFPIMLLKKCLGDPISIVTFESVVVNDSLSYGDVPIEILDHTIQ